MSCCIPLLLFVEEEGVEELVPGVREPGEAPVAAVHGAAGVGALRRREVAAVHRRVRVLPHRRQRRDVEEPDGAPHAPQHGLDHLVLARGGLLAVGGRRVEPNHRSRLAVAVLGHRVGPLLGAVCLFVTARDHGAKAQTENESIFSWMPRTQRHARARACTCPRVWTWTPPLVRQCRERGGSWSPSRGRDANDYL
jgi:hypothetical protein